MWTAILTVGLQILSWVLNRSAASKETKDNFFAWVKASAEDLKSLKLMQWADEQIEWRKKNEWKESL